MIDLRPVGYVIGLLVALLGLAMFLPLLVDLADGQGHWPAFAQSAVLTVMSGGLIALSCQNGTREGLTIQQTFILTTLVWVALPIFGALPFWFGATESRAVDAFFEAMSGLTTTGATVLSGLDQMPRGLLLWRGLLQWIGGIGIIVVAMVFLPELRVGGMQIFRSEGFDTFGKILPRATEISSRISSIYIGLTGICALAYLATGMEPFDASVHAMTTVATGGFANYDASPGAGGIYEGELRLTGQQATQAIPDLTPNFDRYGKITYYGGGINEKILMEHFWNLCIDAPGRTIPLANDITVHGFSEPNGDGTLTTPVAPAGLNGLRVINGTLDSAGFDITLYGSFIVNTPTGTYTHSSSSLVFMGAHPAYIAGDNTYHGFIADDASVAGKIFYIQTGGTFTMENNASSVIRIHGTNTEPPGGPLRSAPQWPPTLTYPSPRSYVYLVSSSPGNLAPYWTFNKLNLATVDMQYVYLLHSDASAHPQVVPAYVEIEDCPGWLRTVFVSLSWTEDTDSNGRIDRIVVQTGPALNMDFSGLTVEVDGYEVSGYIHPGGFPPNQFAILLNEGSYLDTGATPAWRIATNTSLRDTTINAILLIYDGSGFVPIPKTEEIPQDHAPPIIGYTLAVADKNQIFVHFSEPVIQAGGVAEIVAGNFTSMAAGGIASLQRVSPLPAPANNGMREVLLITNNNISAAEIANGVNLTAGAGIEDFTSPPSTHPFDATDPPDLAEPLLLTSHRISDVGLGIVGNGIVEPVYARGNLNPLGGSGPGIVTRFDGSEFLEDEDFVLQAHLYTGLGWNPQLVYANAIPGSFRNGELWLPNFTETSGAGNFSGLVPRPFTGSLTKNFTSNSGNLFDFSLSASDPMVQSERNFEFFFFYPASNLYMGRIEDDTASDWYRRVRPWNIAIHNVADQAGGITIMNNIINPLRNEEVSLYYELNHGGITSIQVFDLSGSLVDVLQRGYQSADKYSVSWNGRNQAGSIVARGIYFIRYVGPGGIDQIRKVLVIK